MSSATTGRGDPSIFFNVLLTDEAANRPKLGELSETVSSVVSREVKHDEQGLHAYFTFRSLAEQNELNDPAWA